MSQIRVDLSRLDINALVGDTPAYRWGRMLVRKVLVPAAAVAGLLWIAGVVR